MLECTGFYRVAHGFLLEGGGFDPLVLGNWTLVLWTGIAFILLLVLLTRFAWKPLQETVKKREERIAGDLTQAEDARKEAEEIRVKHRAELDQAAKEAKALLEEARDRAGTLRGELEAQARLEAQGLIERARSTIEAEKQQALREIKDQVVDLSVAISSKLFEKSIDREDHLREADVLLSKLKEGS